MINTTSISSAPAQRSWFARNEIGKRSALTAAILFFLFFLLFPFVWMVITSFRGGNLFSIADTPFKIDAITLEHYFKLISQTQFLTWMWNSFFVASISSIIALVIGVLAAYALGRLRFKGAAFIAVLVFSTYLLPPALLFIPLKQVVGVLRLSGSVWALILTYQTFLVPFIAWMLSSYFKQLPAELAEAARVDGASRFQAMLIIDFPLVLPGVVSVFFFAFTLSWNEYLYAFTLLNQGSKMPVAVGVVNALQVGDVFFWGQLMAGAVLGSVPVVIVYSFLMDYYLAGLTAGSVKG